MQIACSFRFSARQQWRGPFKPGFRFWLEWGSGLQTSIDYRSKTETIEADIRLAIVPASMARNPNRARSFRRLGASAPMPPICIPIELMLAKPHKANVAIVKERKSSKDFWVPSKA